jgi:hypothetical protein
MGAGDEPTLQEARETLLRAIVASRRNGRKLDYVVIFSKHQRWLQLAVDLCVKDGLLEPGVLVELDRQSSEVRYRLTRKGHALGENP